MDAVLPLPRDFIKPNLGQFEGLQEAEIFLYKTRHREEQTNLFLTK
jgi:hypothetical protein